MIDLILANKKISLFILILLIFFPIGFYQLTFRAPKHKNINTSVQQSTVSQPPQDQRQAISDTDTTAKSKILSTLPQGGSGYVFQDTNINIEYIKSADTFQVEILKDDIDGAKNEAVQWFQQKGLSAQGICTLPVNFYLNYDLSTRLKEKNIPFNPLPPGC